jgi:hypothetical protein
MTMSELKRVIISNQWSYAEIDGENAGLSTLVFYLLNAYPGPRAGIHNISS